MHPFKIRMNKEDVFKLFKVVKHFHKRKVVPIK